MALPTAQLGQLPSMNLATHSPVQIVTPPWKQALTAFLTNTAGGIAKEGVGNAFATDYAKAASAEGLPGATSPTTGTQSFWSQILHGPDWDEKRFREAMRGKESAEQLGAQKAHWTEMAAVDRERLATDIARNNAANAIAALHADYQGQSLAEQKRAARVSETRAQQEQDRRVAESAAQIQNMALKYGLESQELPVKLKLMESKTLPFEQQLLLAAASAVGGQVERGNQRQRTLQELGISGGSVPSNNSDTVNPTQTGTTNRGSGGTVQDSKIPNYLRTVLPGRPTSSITPMPGQVQGIEPGTQYNALPSAGASGQMGQSMAMAATPPDVADLGEPEAITQAQPLQQHLGQDLMSLVGPPQTPNSPTAIQPSSPVNNPNPTPTNTDVYRLAQILARKFGTAPGMGGTPTPGGSGGLPLGYG